MKTFGETIRAFREARGLSLQGVADLCDCSKAHIWELEQGKSANPSIELLARLSDALWLDLGALASVAAAPWKKGAIIESRAPIASPERLGDRPADPPRRGGSVNQ